MKPHVLSLLFLLSAATLHAQWTELNTPSDNALYDIQFPTQDTGYAVGYYGTILKTVDGGDHWNVLNSGTSKQLNSVYFLSGSLGYAAGGHVLPGNSAGDSAIILKTYNGGDTWQTVYQDTDYNFNSIIFINENKGFAAGGSYTLPIILMTEDGGSSWNPVNTDTVDALTEIQFPVPDTGYAVYRGGVLRSVDGGNNWSVVSPPPFPTEEYFPYSLLEGCYFTDSRTGYIAGWYNGALWKTTDAGINWTNADSLHSVTYQLHDVYFPTKQTGYAAGWYGNIYKTVDAGEHWSADTLGMANGNTFYSVCFVNEDYGFAVADSGKIFRRGTRATTGVPQVAEIQWSLSPVPFHFAAMLTFENPGSKIFSLTVYDAAGRTMQKVMHITGSSVEISRKGMPSGAYLFDLKEGNRRVASGKFMVE